jgi:hypothetical protein
MPMPSLTKGAGSIIRDGIYIIANVKADPDTAAEAKLVFDPQGLVVKAVAARRDADTAAIESGALLVRRLSTAQEAVVALGIKAFGHFGSRTAPEYLRLFPVAPSTLVAASTAARTAGFAALAKALASPDLPKELAASASAVTAAYAALDAAAAADATATEALRQAVAAEKAAADAWHTAVRTLRGRLIMLFPRDAKRVTSYFPPRKRAAKAAKVTPVAPQ